MTFKLFKRFHKRNYDIRSTKVWTNSLINTSKSFIHARFGVFHNWLLLIRIVVRIWSEQDDREATPCRKTSEKQLESLFSCFYLITLHRSWTVNQKDEKEFIRVVDLYLLIHRIIITDHNISGLMLFKRWHYRDQTSDLIVKFFLVKFWCKHFLSFIRDLDFSFRNLVAFFLRNDMIIFFFSCFTTKWHINVGDIRIHDFEAVLERVWSCRALASILLIEQWVVLVLRVVIDGQVEFKGRAYHLKWFSYVN